MKATFAQWVHDELEKRNLSRVVAAKRGGISPASLDLVVNETGEPGLIVFQGISRALNVPLETVFRRAGILPEVGEWLPEVLDWNERLKRLPEGQRALILHAVETMLTAVESTSGLR